MKQHRLAIIIAIILFSVPFFWLSPGEMNLGGDSGRLYFYDPATYLNLHVLYKYLGSSHGSELTYYIYLPYVTLLYILKLIFRSPTTLISIFNGITLSVGFYCVHLIVREILGNSKIEVSERNVRSSSILAGLFYVLSQIAIYSGWEKPIITFHQVFLNPFMAWLILKFMLTQTSRYMILALVTTFIFTPNFSIVGAPPFFAFYPITVIFLFLYAKVIRGVTFRWRLLLAGMILFLLIHTFHLVSTVQSIFSSGSSYNQSIFSDADRSGLSYFIAVAGTLKLSRIWMSLAQIQDKQYLALFIIFPVVLVVSFILNRSRAMRLTGLFFLFCFYLASAVTETGFFVYKQFFRVPGFSMFRNFHGQWSYVFFFFYALLFGQAIAVIANRLNKRAALLLFTGLGTIIVGFGLPLLMGAVPMPTDPETGIRNSFRMDPTFEQVLQYFTSSPIDGKVLMLPLTGPGYQLIQGKNGGFYRGLPMLSYLGGKSEFGGYETLRPFHNIFLTAVKNKDYEVLARLFSVMNIRWIYYNSDPYIYGEKFGSLYSYISKYAPKDPEGYSDFIETLPVTKLIDFSNKYHIYSVNDDVYEPHIATKKSIYTNDELQLMFDTRLLKDRQRAVIPVQSAKNKVDPMVLYGMPNALLDEIRDNGHLHKHMPFISRTLDDPLYSLVILREKFDLARVKKNPMQYLDYALFLDAKRIEEIKRFGLTMKVRRQSWSEPLSWEINKWFSYNSWEASLTRYESGIGEIIRWIDRVEVSDEERMYFRIKVNEQLNQHQIVLLRVLYELDKESSEKIYLFDVVNAMYKRLFDAVRLPIIDPSVYTFTLPQYAKREGSYELYLQGEKVEFPNKDNITLTIGDQILKSGATEVRLADGGVTGVTLTMPIANLVHGEKWRNSGIPQEDEDGVTTMVLNNKLGGLTAGLTLEIPSWAPDYTYLISFDFNTHGEDLVFSFINKTPLNDSVRKNAYNILFEKRLTSTDFVTHQSVLFAQSNSTGGFLKIVPFSPNDTGTIQIKNLIIQKVNYPKLAFKKIVPEVPEGEPPALTFKKINPTKYVLDIQGVTAPYTLVFLESFNKNWKLFDPQSETASWKGSVSRFLGRLGRGLVETFIKQEIPNTTTEATNTFIDARTFDTWGKNTVLGRAHTSAIGYANAWQITPEDMGGKTDYTLVLELSTQKWFYIAIIISLSAVVSLIIYYLVVFIWQKKR